ncbi:MAG TPA: hypothetical protein ENK98_08555 [Epsilonproteobacteria bacterium]|nr:hypothetical protein [Campylobacterota bacterium]
MKTEYILYFAVIVLVIAFIMLLQLLLQNLKEKRVTDKLNKCLQGKIHQKVSAKDVEKMIKYIEKNKKHIPFSIYKKSLQTLQTALLKIR